MKKWQWIIAIVLLFVASGCAGPLTTRERVALGGIGLGAGSGAVIGSATGHAKEGAMIGAAIGGLGGAVVGDQIQGREERVQGDVDWELERQRRELERQRRELEDLRRSRYGYY